MTEFLAAGTVHGPAQPHVVDALQDEFARIWPRASEIRPEDRMPFELAVVEIASNVVQHAHATEGRVLELAVELEIRRNVLLARLYEINAEPLPDVLGDGELPPPEAEHGRGLGMVRQLVTTVTCERQKDTNVWTLSRTPESS